MFLKIFFFFHFLHFDKFFVFFGNLKEHLALINWNTFYRMILVIA